MTNLTCRSSAGTLGATGMVATITINIWYINHTHRRWKKGAKDRDGHRNTVGGLP
ncbi:hypothetical protein HanIR_Chr12g0571431 [Helianthus annuus]|nr:hypothetical protein HanIR_Chr12g0571431 [Helianthus annuus]